MTGTVIFAALAVGFISVGVGMLLGWVALPICLGLGMLVGLVAGRV